MAHVDGAVVLAGTYSPIAGRPRRRGFDFISDGRRRSFKLSYSTTATSAAMVASSGFRIPILLAPRLPASTPSESFQFLYHAIYLPGSATIVEDLRAHVHGSIELSSRPIVPLALGEAFEVQIRQVRRRIGGSLGMHSPVLWTARGTDPVPRYNDGCEQGGIRSCHFRIFGATC